jgi:hypothetical protein
MKIEIKNDIIDVCINEIFKKNCINHLRKKENWEPSPFEIYIEISGKNINVLKKHPVQNERRIGFLLKLLELTLLHHNLYLNCKILFNLTDGIDENEYYTRICFSAALDSNHILMPDLHLFYHIQTIDQHLDGDSLFESKQDKIAFYGSDSGLIDESLLNQRVKFCSKAFGNDSVISKISNFVHFTEDMLEDLGVKKEEISAQPVSIKDQLDYKYILNIDGNTSSWDRILWAMSSNCYFIHLKSNKNKSVNWYMPYVYKNNIMPILEEKEILEGKVFYDADVKRKQKEFADSLLHQATQLEYFARLLTKYDQLYNS